jgi:hypothetical protein
MLHRDLHDHTFRIQIVQELSEQDKACCVVLQLVLELGVKQSRHSECTTDVR